MAEATWSKRAKDCLACSTFVIELSCDRPLVRYQRPRLPLRLVSHSFPAATDRTAREHSLVATKAHKRSKAQEKIGLKLRHYT